MNYIVVLLIFLINVFVIDAYDPTLCVNLDTIESCQKHSELYCIWCNNSDTCLNYDPCNNSTNPEECTNIILTNNMGSCSDFMLTGYVLLFLIVGTFGVAYLCICISCFYMNNDNEKYIVITIIHWIFLLYSILNVLAIIASVILYIIASIENDSNLINISFLILVYLLIIEMFIAALLFLVVGILLLLGYCVIPRCENMKFRILSCFTMNKYTEINKYKEINNTEEELL